MAAYDNLAILRHALEAWSSADRKSEYFQAYAPDAVIHTSGARTLDELRPFYESVWAAFPDAKATIGESVEEGDKLAYRVSVLGTHRGSFGGLPATGRRIAISEVGILEFADGKIVRRWGHSNAHELLAQLQG